MTVERTNPTPNPVADEERTARERQTQRWENEGGSSRTSSRKVNAPPAASDRPKAPRVHHFGEGQTERTITQDEQDRLAQRSDKRRGGPYAR